MNIPWNLYMGIYISHEFSWWIHSPSGINEFMTVTDLSTSWLSWPVEPTCYEFIQWGNFGVQHEIKRSNENV